MAIPEKQGGLAHEALLVTGRATAETIQPVEHEKSCSGVQWMTHKKSEINDTDHELQEDEAVCENCGVKSTVNDSETRQNVIVDTFGAEDITDLIASGSGVSYDRMKIGSTTSPTAPAEGDTQLSNTVATSPTLTPTQQSTGGAEKKVVWSNTFASSTGRSSVVSLGMDTGTATGTNAHLLNRVTFSAKDNANNDLSLTYELTVS